MLELGIMLFTKEISHFMLWKKALSTRFEGRILDLPHCHKILKLRSALHMCHF